MRSTLLTLFFSFIFSCLHAQNLLSNGGFETTTGGCPGATLGATLSDWAPYYGSINYRSTCNGTVPNNTLDTQYAAEGDAYVMILAYKYLTDARQYFRSPMTAMTVNKRYEVSMSASWVRRNSNVQRFGGLFL